MVAGGAERGGGVWTGIPGREQYNSGSGGVEVEIGSVRVARQRPQCVLGGEWGRGESWRRERRGGERESGG